MGPGRSFFELIALIAIKKSSKFGVKVFTIFTRSPYKPLRKPLIYSRLKINFIKICPFLTIFLNTYSLALTKQWHTTPNKPAKSLPATTKTPLNNVRSRINSFS